MNQQQINSMKRALQNFRDFLYMHPDSVGLACKELAGYLNQVAKAQKGPLQAIYQEIGQELLELHGKAEGLLASSAKAPVKPSKQEADDDENWSEDELDDLGYDENDLELDEDSEDDEFDEDDDEDEEDDADLEYERDDE